MVKAIEDALSSEHLPRETLGRLDPDAIQVARTASRSTLGFMNELAHQLRYDVAATGGLHSCDLGEINHRLRRILLGKAGYSYPIELAARRLAADEAGRDR